jgi:hypothetical protein
VWDGGSGVSDFCLFLVFLARYVSSVVARSLLYEAHAICFLPLVCTSFFSPDLIVEENYKGAMYTTLNHIVEVGTLIIPLRILIS